MRKRRRIVLLFGLGIVLPSLVLGFLALRGVQNDQALIEKEKLEETRQAAERIIHAVDEKITALETVYSKAIADELGTPAASLKDILASAAQENPLVEEFFSLHDEKKINFPLARLLYVPDGHRETDPPPIANPGLSEELKMAQQLEFQQNDYPKALAAYRRAFKLTADPCFRGMILNAIARIQTKSGRFIESISTYEKIVQDLNDAVLPEGIPLGPAALLEICEILREIQDLAGSLRTSLRLYRALLHGDWILEKAEYEFFAEHAVRLIEESFSGQPAGAGLDRLLAEFGNLKNKETRQREKTERMIAFQESAPSALSARVSGETFESRSSLRMVLNIGDFSFFVSILKAAPPKNKTPLKALGFLIDADGIMESILRPALLDDISSGEVSWAVKERNGNVVLSAGNSSPGPAAFRAYFVSNVPDWTLEFYQPPPRLIATFLLSRRGFYFYVFLLLAGILIFGLALTIRTVSREMELARMKSDFVSTVSHALKSPLTSIRQIAEMLQTGRVPSEERRQTYYDVLLEQSERLSLLTDNILSLAKIEEGRAEFMFESSDIPALLTETVSSIQDRVRHEGFDIRLNIEGPIPRLRADPSALSQAVANLIDNAIKYSGVSRKILVGASAGEKTLTISVRDFGVGIAKEDIDRIFERFYRGGNVLTRTVKGSGLGLTLVKRIVEVHRGKVHVESEPGKGSVFSIRLPLPPGEGEKNDENPDH